jgi:2-polyprenyl-6-methoxyphenol hydroxylase-like FAD-dependent oxidoreductase
VPAGHPAMNTEPVEVLVVGAGPTGLTLAARLRSFGATFRIVDRQPDRVHESRALAVQPRTLEVLAGLGIAETMVERGNPGVRLQMHIGSRRTEVPLFDIGLDDTAYPFLLFLSQAATEAILGEHLAQRGAPVERGVELIDLRQDPDRVTSTLRHHDGRTEEVTARYVVGCDGAHSSVRDRAGIGFVGSAYPQTFVLADTGAEGLDPGAAHVYLAEPGMVFFFPLAHPAPWRLLGMQPRGGEHDRSGDDPLDLAQLQALVDPYTSATVRLRDPVWTTYFRIHHRHATSYRSGRVFLAGDAAHIHSPAGAQGMNTGIQDAWNLAWKLALVVDGTANPALLDTYQAERQPVGRFVLRFTDRAFTIATSTNRLIRLLRTHVAPRLIHLALGTARGRAAGFRALSQLAISYRDSPAVEEGHPHLRRGPHAGDRLPDAPVAVDGQLQTLHQALAAPRFHLLLTGTGAQWPADTATVLEARHAAHVDTHRLTRRPETGRLVDLHGHAHRRLGLDRTDRPAHYLIRPDLHIAYRAAGTDPTGLRAYLDRWLADAPTASGA